MFLSIIIPLLSQEDPIGIFRLDPLATNSLGFPSSENGHLRHHQTDRGLFRHKGSVPSPEYQEPPQAGTAQPFPCQGTKRSGPPSGPRASKVLREASPLSGAPGLGHGFSEDEEELPSLAFLLGLHHSLLPWGLPQSPVPASGLVCTAGQRAQQASQAPVPQRMGLSSGPLEAAKSRMQAQCGGLAAAEELGMESCFCAIQPSGHSPVMGMEVVGIPYL